MVIVASSKYQIARNAPSEDSLCAGWVPFRENSGGLSDENGGFLHAQLGSGRAHTSASLHEWYPVLCEQPNVKSQTNNMLISEKLMVSC